MRVLMYLEYGDEPREDDKFLCPSCNSSLMYEIGHEFYQCEDMYCSKQHWLYELSIIARKTDE